MITKYKKPPVCKTHTLRQSETAGYYHLEHGKRVKWTRVCQVCGTRVDEALV